MIKLKEVAHYVSDKINISALTRNEYITTDNMLPNKGGITDCENLPQAARVTKYECGDILVSNIRPYFKKIWYANKVGGCSNDVIVFRANNDGWNSKFLYYVLSQNSFFDFVMSGANGTKMPRGNKDLILDFLVPNFNTKKQKNIADVLSAYDDMIENNQKQIKLLEEAAQRLYKEWFVDFRFPGYENAKFIDGIPEGWKVRPLSEIFDFIRGKSYASKELVDQGGVIMINLKNIKAFGGYKRNVEKRFIGKFKDEQKILAGDIVMGVTDMTKERRLVGYVAIIPNLGETAIFSMDLIKLIPKTVTRGYLYTTMLYGEYSKRISLLANGVNVLHLKPDAIMGITMLVPSEIIMEQYEHKFELYRQKIELLQTQCNIFTEARGRLLPKLMSGEIEV